MMKARRQERMARREAADKIKESRKAAAVKQVNSLFEQVLLGQYEQGILVGNLLAFDSFDRMSG